MKGFILATIFSFVIRQIWYEEEYKEFGKLQQNRKCDMKVWILYYIALWRAFDK